LPSSLRNQQEALGRCLEAMDRALPLRRAILFGSHARGDARPDSDVDLCLATDGAERQLEAAQRFGEAIWDVWPRLPLTLIPITPVRLGVKQAIRDYFFGSILKEGVLMAEED
jgi:predicted nucleotidyltransferase